MGRRRSATWSGLTALLLKHWWKNINKSKTAKIQGHLFRYAENKLLQLGKRMVGWEEAIPRRQGEQRDHHLLVAQPKKPPWTVARQGFDVVLQLAQFTYLDMTQDYAPKSRAWWLAKPLSH